MTKDKSIYIKNVYYMLSYAFQVLKQSDYAQVQVEPFDDIEDLFAAILAKGVARQLKQGLYRTYIGRQESLTVLRGKLDIPGTIRNRIQHSRTLVCEYDELSENNLFNQILKTTIRYMVKAESVKPDRKSELKKVNVFFGSIDTIDPAGIQWARLIYQRNNKNYELLMNLCYFVLDGMLQTTESGEYKVLEFSDEHMNLLFQRFVFEYYRTHHTKLSVSAPKVKWNTDVKSDEGLIQFLPEMQTDIVLRLKEKVLIIDTKYYGKVLLPHFDKYTLSSGNVFQIHAYVKNMDADQTGNVSGLLLYAKTDEAIAPDGGAMVGKNWIGAETLDLNCDFPEIAKQLDEVVMDWIDRNCAAGGQT